MSPYDATAPWNIHVNGEQVLPLINDDHAVFRIQAGPGTGKTFGLRRRVLRALHPDGLALDPNSVLVCAFNRTIARDLAKEIEAELDQYDLPLPVIRTVHALCMQLAGATPRFLLPHEVDVMVYDIRVGFPAINTLYEGRQSKALRALREHDARLVNHAALATAVQGWLADHHAALVGDVPRQIEAALDGGGILQPRFRHVVVDEFQDLTETETRVLVRLREAGGQFIAVGDRKQSIYAFRGNAERGLNALPDLVAQAVDDHTMDECQRCPQEIVRLANEVMALEGEPLVDILGPGAPISRIHFGSPDAEAAGLAQHIAEAYAKYPERRHLVLVTRRKWGYDLRNELRDTAPDVPVYTVFSEDILETWPALEAFMFLSVVGDENDPVAMRDWIAYQPSMDGRAYKAPQRNADAYLRLKAWHGTLTRPAAAVLAVQNRAEFRGAGRTNVLNRLDRLAVLWTQLPNTQDAQTLVAHILDPPRWVTHQGGNAALAAEDIGRLRREADRMIASTPDATIAGIVTGLRFRIATREPLGDEPNPAAVQIVTLWGAKGLTADYVYIGGLVDEALPGPHDEDSSGLTPAEHLDEQRRLLYVSLTRAKHGLVISKPTKIRVGQIAALGLLRTTKRNTYWQYLSDCRFLANVSLTNLPASQDGTAWAGIP